MSHASRIIATIYKICDNELKAIDRQRKILKAENHFPDVLGGTFDNDARIIELRKDTGKILEIKQYFNKLKG